MRTRSRWRFIASTYCDGTAENLAWWEFGIFLIGGQIGVAGGDLVWSIVLVGKKMSANVKVFGCRPFIDLCCPPRQGRRSKTSKEGNRESEGRRRRCDLWGFESRWRLLSSGRNDYQR